MATGVEILTEDHEPLLSPGMSCSVSVRNSGAGQISITYPLEGVRADQLAAGLLVRVRASSGVEAVELAPYVLKDFRVDVTKDNRTPIGVWQGVQHGWFALERSMVLPATIEDSFPVALMWGTPGFVMENLILTYARTYRGVLTRLSITGSDTLDAAGDAWEEIFANVKVPWETKASDVLSMISVEDPTCEWDFRAIPTLGGDETDPDILTWLRLYNPGSMGNDRTVTAPGVKPMIISTGKGVTSAPRTQSVGVGPVHRVLAYNKDGDYFFAETEDIDEVDEVYEIGLALLDEENLAALERRANRHLAMMRKIWTEQSLSLDLSGQDTLPVPGVGVNVGDYFYVDLGGEGNVRRRLAEWSLTLTAEGQITGGMVLDEVLRTRSGRFDRSLFQDRRQIGLIAGGLYA